MLRQEDKYAYGSGVFPDWSATNTTGPGLTDGSPYVAENISDGWEGVSQAIMRYAFNNGLTQKTNTPIGTIGEPNGVPEARGVSQILQALQKAHGIGPGTYVLWGGGDYVLPAGERVLMLGAQTVLITDYPALDDACYVGDVNNTTVFNTGGYFYRSSDSAGLIPNIAGPYLKLPPQPRPTFLKIYDGIALGVVSISISNPVGIYARLIPYQTLSGEARLKGSLSFECQAATRTSAFWTISGVNFGIGRQGASTNVYNEGTPQTSAGHVVSVTGNAGGSNIFINHLSVPTSQYITYFDLKTISLPAWSTDFYYKWGIRY